MKSTNDKKIQTPLARARGYGSAHDGAHHWLLERMTSIALVPLTVWLIWSVLKIKDLDYIGFTLWLSEPWNAALMMLSVGIGFWHAAMGLQVVIEDYVASNGTKLFCIILTKFSFFAMFALSAVSILKIAL